MKLTAAKLSLLQRWWLATRPKTLIASFAPVFLGSALAWYHHSFYLPIFILILIAALTIQIATNFFNEVYDYRKGADTPQRLGPPRLVAQQLIAPTTMFRAALIALFIALIAGIPLILRGGFPIILIGVFSLFLAWAYTGGPVPLAYVGLGEVFVFLFFGVIAVTGTYYLHTLQWSTDALWLSMVPGALSTALLLVNNIRDIPTDWQSGKRTLSVRFGRRWSEYLYRGLLLLPFFTTIVLLLRGYPQWLLLDSAALPPTLQLMSAISEVQGQALNQLLKKTAQLLWLHTILLTGGFILSSAF